MKYADKLKDPRWQKFRLKILDRDDFTCQMCGATDETLHAHHLAYKVDGKRVEPWEVPPKWVVTLCESCHEREHMDREEMEKRLAEALRVQGWTCQGVWMLKEWVMNQSKPMLSWGESNASPCD